MKNYIQPGENIEIIAAADIESGDFVVVGALSGVAQHDAATGEALTLARRGGFTVPKTSAQTWTQGDRIYWDAAEEECTTVADGNLLIGGALADAANPSSTGDVLLIGGLNSVADSFAQAAFVADAAAGSAAEINALRDALVTAGLMAAS